MSDFKAKMHQIWFLPRLRSRGGRGKLEFGRPCTSFFHFKHCRMASMGVLSQQGQSSSLSSRLLYWKTSDCIVIARLWFKVLRCGCSVDIRLQEVIAAHAALRSEGGIVLEVSVCVLDVNIITREPLEISSWNVHWLKGGQVPKWLLWGARVVR